MQIEVKEELLIKAKLRVRKMKSDDLDKDIKDLASAALADLKRIGVHEAYLMEQNDPLIREAVLNYVSANYGASEKHEQYMNMYNMILTKIKGGGYKEWMKS